MIGCKNEQNQKHQDQTIADQTASKVVLPVQKENRDTLLFSLLGKPLLAPEVSDELQKKLEQKERTYFEDTTNVDNLIWYGRFLAYAGQYKEAIELYSKGIQENPRDPRLYRHRGHRFITMRQFENAIDDFEKAKFLMQGMPIQVEPDGMPNEKNIPISSLQSNVLYHLGLSYYLTGELYKADKNFQACMALNTNDDNLISALYWAYLTARKSGSLNTARKLMDMVKPEMNIIENHVYHKLCLHFQQSLSEYDLREFAKTQAESSQSAVEYGLGIWQLSENRPHLTEAAFRRIVRGKDWNSFGHIAAEVDLTKFK